MLESWNVITTVFSYFGHKHEVISLLQYMSGRSRTYAKSHHMKLLVVNLVPHRWRPYYDAPIDIDMKDVDKNASKKG